MQLIREDVEFNTLHCGSSRFLRFPIQDACRDEIRVRSYHDQLLLIIGHGKAYNCSLEVDLDPATA